MASRGQGSLFSASGDMPPAELCPGGLVVREVCCRSVLNRSGVDDYSFNCYRGCAHGCAYCYARLMQRFYPHEQPWGSFVDVKINAVDVLRREVRQLAPGSVFTCSACDGWQPVEQHYELTRRCCRILLDAGFHLEILTKSRLVLRDLDILAGRDVRLGVTITTAREAVAARWEPRASPVMDRWEILRAAKLAGLRTAVMFGPLLPHISDTPESLRELFTCAAAIGVDRVWTDGLNPRPGVWPAVRSLLQGWRDDLVAAYRSILFDRLIRSQYLSGLKQRVLQAAAETGMTDRLAD